MVLERYPVAMMKSFIVRSQMTPFNNSSSIMCSSISIFNFLNKNFRINLVSRFVYFEMEKRAKMSRSPTQGNAHIART